MCCKVSVHCSKLSCFLSSKLQWTFSLWLAGVRETLAGRFHFLLNPAKWKMNWSKRKTKFGKIHDIVKGICFRWLKVHINILGAFCNSAWGPDTSVCLTVRLSKCNKHILAKGIISDSLPNLLFIATPQFFYSCLIIFITVLLSSNLSPIREVNVFFKYISD
jgi:hypothetical protein